MLRALHRSRQLSISPTYSTGLGMPASACFSRCSRRCDSKGVNPSSTDEGQGRKQKHTGSYTRVLAAFAISASVGWAARTYLDDGKRSNTASPGEFVRYALVNKEGVSSTCSLFTLKPAGNISIDVRELHNNRAITSVQVKQPQLQIARSYTVLPSLEGQDADELRFLIRQERKGEVSGYLHRLPLGSEIELRGPSVDYVLPEHVQEVVFLAGGTGIVPAMQVASKIEGQAGMHILWATRRREDCAGGVSDARPTKPALGWDFAGWWSSFGSPSSGSGKMLSGVKSEQNPIVSQIGSLKARNEHMTTDYYVDDESTFIRPVDITALTGITAKSGVDGNPAVRLLLVSGPEGFVSYWAGPKQWASGREVQGPLGGILSTLDLRGWTVVKL